MTVPAIHKEHNRSGPRKMKDQRKDDERGEQVPWMAIMGPAIVKMNLTEDDCDGEGRQVLILACSNIPAMPPTLSFCEENALSQG
jgi:hypothetical protein